MNLLAIETATDMCSVALSVQNKLYKEERVAPQQHAQIVLPMVEQVLGQAGLKVNQLDGIVFGQGPGSFTGVRIAAAVTQGIAYSANLPVYGVSTLQAMAQQVTKANDERVFVAMDARMKEVYWCAYEPDTQGIMQPLLEEQVCAPDQIDFASIFKERHWACLGSGIEQYPQQFEPLLARANCTLHGDIEPSAEPMLLIARPEFESGDAKPAEQAVPVYIRNKVALTEAERASGETL